MKDLITTKEFAAALGVTDAYVRQMIIAGKVAAEKIGRDHFITTAELEKAKARRTQRGPEAGAKKASARPAARAKKASK